MAAATAGHAEGGTTLEDGTETKRADQALVELHTRGEVKLRIQAKVVQQPRTNDPLYLRAMAGKAPIYQYYFQWYSPVREGKLRSMHTMDIPFAFDNVEIARTEIGNGPERQPLADRMARAWVAFARTGNPSHLGLPAWSAYTIPQPIAIMIIHTR